MYLGTFRPRSEKRVGEGEGEGPSLLAVILWLAGPDTSGYKSRMMSIMGIIVL